MTTFPNLVGAELVDCKHSFIGDIISQQVEDGKLWLNVDGDFEIPFSDIMTHNGSPTVAATVAVARFDVVNGKV